MFLLILLDILLQKVVITTCLFSFKQNKGYIKTLLNSTALPPLRFSIFPYQNFHLYFSNTYIKSLFSHCMCSLEGVRFLLGLDVCNRKTNIIMA